MKYTDPEQISPINGTEELLLAIYDRLGDLLEALKPTPLEPVLRESVSEEMASVAGKALAVHEHESKPARKPRPRKKKAT